MKKIILLLTLCFSIIHLHAQSDKKNMIGTHVSIGMGGYGPTRMKGAPSYHTKYYYAIGLDYSRQLSKRWDLCSGYEYTYTEMTVSLLAPPTPISSSLEEFSVKANLSMSTIPVQLKYHFGKLVYLNGGLLLNVVAKEKIKGIWTNEDFKANIALLLGIGLGIGFEHEFKSGILLSLNPYARLNGIGKAISLQSEAAEQYIYFQGGVSFGVGYKF